MFDYEKLATQKRERRSWKSKRQSQSRRIHGPSFRYLARVLESNPTSFLEAHDA
jgi:hypothetical protein